MTPRQKRIGIIIVPPGVMLTIHEKMTVDLLAVKLGVDIAFLPASRSEGTKTPDIKMHGLYWEIKSPKGKSSRTIENNLRAALRQSPNIIFDLRRIDGRIPTKKHLSDIEKQFNLSRSIKHIIVITRQEEIIDFTR